MLYEVITHDIRRENLKIYKYLDSSLENYYALYERVNSKEEYVIINKDTFILQATLIESGHKLFTLTKITKLSNEMQIDSLTGAYKKNYFNLQLEKLLKNKEEGILVVLDLDNFKNVNDTYGHQVGVITSYSIHYTKLYDHKIHSCDKESQNDKWCKFLKHYIILIILYFLNL